MARNKPGVTQNPPCYYDDAPNLNQQGYHPAAYTDGSDGRRLPQRSSTHGSVLTPCNNCESCNLLHQPSSSYGSVRVPRNIYEDRNLPSQQSSNCGSVPAQQKTSHTLTKSLGFFVLVAISMTIVLIYFYPQAHDRIRREWEAEKRAHQIMHDAWISDRKAIVMERETWQKERADHILEREAAAAEMEQWRIDHILEREAAAAEMEQWRKAHILEREAAAAEREQWRRERTDHENRQRQEEEEKRALIVWQDLKASTQCLRYGTREYSATLAQVPLGMDPLKECWNKSIDIHGRQLYPSRCDTQGMCGTVTGHWIVDFNEATCVTWWRGYDDKHCVERGIHRYESVLENLQWGDDWHVMCATTPGRVQGRNFDGPTSCASWRSGINAIWLVEDENCH